jgi:hypothetical protein
MEFQPIFYEIAKELPITYVWLTTIQQNYYLGSGFIDAHINKHTFVLWIHLCTSQTRCLSDYCVDHMHLRMDMIIVLEINRVLLFLNHNNYQSIWELFDQIDKSIKRFNSLHNNN